MIYFYISPNGRTTSNRRGFDVDITSNVEDQISTNFHVISAYFFDAVSIVEKSTWFPRTFFDLISLVEKSTLFPRTFFDVISIVEKSTLFPRTFFDVISMVEICTLFLFTFFDVILIGKDLISLLVSCKQMKTFEKVFSCICNFKQLTFARLFSLNFPR